MRSSNIKILATVVFTAVFIDSKLVIGPVICNSNWKSSSIGKSGACSHHGGVASWKGGLPFLLSGAPAFLLYGFAVNRCPPDRREDENPENDDSSEPVNIDPKLMVPDLESKSKREPMLPPPEEETGAR